MRWAVALFVLGLCFAAAPAAAESALTKPNNDASLGPLRFDRGFGARARSVRPVRHPPPRRSRDPRLDAPAGAGSSP